MIKPSIFLLFVSAFLAPACSQDGQTSNSAMTVQEHAERQQVDLAVNEAINEPGGGDYARAVEIIQRSDRPFDVKRYQIAQLIVGSHAQPGSRRPPQTLQEGLAILEQTAVEGVPGIEGAAQGLRMTFERGVGSPPDGIPIDPVVADCWHKLENGGAGDPAKCVALRRERLPQLSVGSGG